MQDMEEANSLGDKMVKNRGMQQKLYHLSQSVPVRPFCLGEMAGRMMVFGSTPVGWVCDLISHIPQDRIDTVAENS